jgi:hypothetical protein
MLKLGEIKNHLYYVSLTSLFIGRVINYLLEHLIMTALVQHQPSEGSVGISKCYHKLFRMIQSILFNELALNDIFIKASKSLVKYVVMLAS